MLQLGLGAEPNKEYNEKRHFNCESSEGDSMDSPSIKVPDPHLRRSPVSGPDQEVHSKVIRWIGKITEFDVVFHHRRSTDKAIHIADGLSRLTGEPQDQPRLIPNGLELMIASATEAERCLDSVPCWGRGPGGGGGCKFGLQKATP